MRRLTKEMPNRSSSSPGHSGENFCAHFNSLPTFATAGGRDSWAALLLQLSPNTSLRALSWTQGKEPGKSLLKNSSWAGLATSAGPCRVETSASTSRHSYVLNWQAQGGQDIVPDSFEGEGARSFFLSPCWMCGILPGR